MILEGPAAPGLDHRTGAVPPTIRHAGTVPTPPLAPRRPDDLRGLRVAGTVLLALAVLSWAASAIWLRATAGAEGGVDFGPMWLVLAALFTGVPGLAFLAVAAAATRRDRQRDRGSDRKRVRGSDRDRARRSPDGAGR